MSVLSMLFMECTVLAQNGATIAKHEHWDATAFGSLAEKFKTPDWGFYTLKRRVLYAHVKERPEDNLLTIDNSVRVIEASLAKEEGILEVVAGLHNDAVRLPSEQDTDGALVVRLLVIPNEDWANLKKYQSDNETVSRLPANAKRVVFMGNSITEKWEKYDSLFFKHNPYISRGISGQTTGQMLLRFRQDVINLHPEVVVIHAGTNDIAANRGLSTIDQIAGNIFSMCELAQANGIRVVVASLLPATSYSWRPGIYPADKIIELNSLLKAYAEAHDLTYLDYYSAMVNESKGLKEAYGRDSVHPGTAGYQVMGKLAKAAIEKALAGEK